MVLMKGRKFMVLMKGMQFLVLMKGKHKNQELMKGISSWFL